MGDLILVVAFGIGAAAVIGAVSYYLLITTEGVYLGQGVVTWLYDVYARRYNSIKGFTPEYEQLFIAFPLLETIGDSEMPMILDVATGTGRVPLALRANPYFQGTVIGLDHSLRMLREAVDHLAADPDVTFLRGDGLHLPFADSTFDGVVCLEALEFMPDPEQALREMVRVLKPNHPLFITRRRGWVAKVMPGRAHSRSRMISFLEHKLGVIGVQVHPWQVDYEQIWGFKATGHQAE